MTDLQIVVFSAVFAIILIAPMLLLWRYVRSGNSRGRLESERRNGLVLRRFLVIVGIFGLIKALTNLLSNTPPAITGKWAFAWNFVYVHFGQIGVSVTWALLAVTCLAVTLQVGRKAQ